MLSMVFRLVASVVLLLLTVSLGAEGLAELDRILAQVEAGEYAAAEARARDLLTEAEAAFGADSPEAAEVLAVLVLAIAEQRLIDDDDIEMARRLVRLRRLLLGTDHPKVADSLLTLSFMLGRHNDFPAAVAAAEEAVAIRTRALGPDHPETALALAKHASALYRQGRYADALPLLETALAIQTAKLEPDDLVISHTANGLASTAYQIGDYKAARGNWERALEIRTNALGADHPSVAQSLNNIALMYYHEADFVKSLATYRRALAIREKSLGPDHQAVGYSLNGIAHCLLETGDFASARTHFERALAIFENTLGPGDQETVICRRLLAEVMIKTGDAVRALEIVIELLESADSVFGPDHHWAGNLYATRASALLAIGNFDAARQALDQGLTILEASLGPDHADVAIFLGNSAFASWKVSDRKQALAQQRRAILIFSETLGAEHPETARAEQQLAQWFHAQDDTTAARALLENALKKLEAAYGSDHPDVGSCLLALSDVLSDSGEADAAFEAARRAERIGREHFTLVLKALAESEALRYADLRISGRDSMLSMLAEGSVTGRVATLAAWDAVIRSRALVLDEMVTRQRATQVDEPNVSRLRAQVAAAQENLVRLVIRGVGNEPAEQHSEQLKAARTLVELAERSLAAASAAFRDQQHWAEVGIEDVLDALPAGSGLIAFTVFSHGGHGDDDTGIESYGLFVLPSRGADPIFDRLGDREGLDRVISRWRDHLHRADAGEAACRAAGEPVRQATWDPFASSLAQSSRLFVIPDGLFNLVNLVALPTADGRYLVETGPQLHSLTSERDLVSVTATPPLGKGLLALGGVSFDADPSGSSGEKETPGTFRGALPTCASFQSIRFEPLPATAKEVKKIADVWTAADTEAATGEVVSLTGADASEAAFKTSAPGKRVLHLATHAFFLDGVCPTGARRMRGVGGLVPAQGDSKTPAVEENMLHLAGFALAGANQRAHATPDHEDGVLTAEEVGALDLGGVEWAVLSGCDTGTGVIAEGEGVLGLRRAFRIAGVRTVIMSLWPVDDESARIWMEALYHQRLTEGRTTAEAVHVTTVEALQARRSRDLDTHPASWASFIAAGEWE